MLDTISKPEPSEPLKANAYLMRCLMGGHLDLKECERRALGVERRCCTNRLSDSSCESSVVAVVHEQTHTPDLQDQELAGLQ